MEYFIHLAILVGIQLIVAQSFNIVFGLGRLLNLAQIAAWALGAYAAALLSTELQCGFWICIAASMMVSAFFALLVGAISLKLSEDYFAIGTLAFNAVISALLINWKSLTHGVYGIVGIPRPVINLPYLIEKSGTTAEDYFYNNLHFLVLVLICDALVLSYCWVVFRSRLGRSLRSLAENEFAGISLGQNVRAVRNDAFILSSMFAGLAGALFAYYINYIDPTMFGLSEMVFVLSIVVIGSPGSFRGCIIATAFLVLLPEPLRFVEIPSDILGPMRQLLQALILFGVIWWKRETLFPAERKV